MLTKILTQFYNTFRLVGFWNYDDYDDDGGNNNNNSRPAYVEEDLELNFHIQFWNVILLVFTQLENCLAKKLNYLLNLILAHPHTPPTSSLPSIRTWKTGEKAWHNS